MSTALNQAKAGRAIILEQMRNAIAEPRRDLSPFAPRITTMRINPADPVKLSAVVVWSPPGVLPVPSKVNFSQLGPTEALR